MRQLFFSALLLATSFSSIAQTPVSGRKIQVAILFDTSNSMDGLIDQAKSRIWNIVNEIGTLKHNGQSPIMEFAVYQYGNDGLEMSDNYIQLVQDLTSDMDDLSASLFGLKTNGGSEFCGAVIEKSLDDLAWSPSTNDLKMIYIAGNESFSQGPIDYKEVCKIALKREIFINTIHCGSYEQGVSHFWKDGATIGGGDYYNIDSDKAIAHIDTPYDQEIQTYNDSVNSTYYGYGSIGIRKKEMQLSEDANAASQAGAVMTERAITKSKSSTYSNSSWDMIDAVNEGKDISEMDEDELPEEFKNLSDEDKKAKVDSINLDRKRFQDKISDLSVERQNYIDEEMKKKAEAGEVDDFGTSVNDGIIKRAKEVGLVKESDDE